VQYQYEGDAGIGRHALEEAMEGLDAPRRRTDSNDWKFAGGHRATGQGKAVTI
jgi:hypothetical protein